MLSAVIRFHGGEPVQACEYDLGPNLGYLSQIKWKHFEFSRRMMDSIEPNLMGNLLDIRVR